MISLFEQGARLPVIGGRAGLVTIWRHTSTLCSGMISLALMLFILSASMLYAQSTAAQSSALKPAINKTLRMAYDADPVSLDPHEFLTGATLQFSHMAFDPLVRWRQDFSVEPRLAERWEQKDVNRVRFYLRKGVKFHSGNPFTASDVVWTFNRLKKSIDFKGLFEPFLRAEYIDEYTVDIITSRPYPLVLNMATYIFPMDSKFYSGLDERGQPKNAIIKHGKSFASTHVSGTGPYILKSREQGVRLLFERNPNYWDYASKGNVKSIIFTPIKEGATRVAALLSGEIDFIAPVPPTDLFRINRDKKNDLIGMRGTRVILLTLDQKRRKEFQDPRVRRAIAYAVNNKGIAKKIMRNFATPAAQLSPPEFQGHNQALKPRFDLAKARQLMKQAGYEKGFSVTMMAPNNRYVNDYKIARAVTSMLAKINIKVDLKTMPKAQYWQKFDQRAADIMMIGWHPDTEDSVNYYEFLVMTPDKKTGYGQYNSGNYSNKVVDTLINETRSMNDLQLRAQLLQRIEQILYDDAAFIPLHWQHLAWAARKGVHIEEVVNVMNMPYLGDLRID